MSGTAVTSSGLKSKNNYTLRLAEVMGWSGKTDEKDALTFLRLQNAKNLIMAQERLITEKVCWKINLNSQLTLSYVGTSRFMFVPIWSNCRTVYNRDFSYTKRHSINES